MFGPGQTGAYAALTLISVLWGSYPAFAKLALVAFPPLVLVVLRCGIASVFLAVLLLRRGWSEFTALRWRDLGPLAFLGFAGIFVSTGGTYLAIAFTTASSAVLLQPATPVMVAIGARLYLGKGPGGERLGRLQWAGVACSAVGVGLIITKGSWRAIMHLNLRPGDFILLAAQVGWAVYTVYGKRVLARHSPVVATTAAYILGSLMLLPLPFLTARLFAAPDFTSPVAWGVVFYQAILGSVAHIWWYEAVHAVGPSRSAVFMNLQPVVGVLLAWAMLGERITLSSLLGGAAVLTGVALTSRRAPAGKAN
ncbi:MAG TPA: EamA family transporter [Methylomirabilota bacterium]